VKVLKSIQYTTKSDTYWIVSLALKNEVFTTFHD